MRLLRGAVGFGSHEDDVAPLLLGQGPGRKGSTFGGHNHENSVLVVYSDHKGIP